jgi:hypothetical protein
MSHVAQEVFDLDVECACGWRGKMLGYRAHLVREHRNVNDCGARAEALVSFGYRNPGFTQVGASMGVCPRHREYLRAGQMHLIVEDLRIGSRR